MSYTNFRTEEGAELFSLHQRQLGFRTCVIYVASRNRWEVRSW